MILQLIVLGRRSRIPIKNEVRVWSKRILCRTARKKLVGFRKGPMICVSKSVSKFAVLSMFTLLMKCVDEGV